MERYGQSHWMVGQLSMRRVGLRSDRSISLTPFHFRALGGDLSFPVVWWCAVMGQFFACILIFVTALEWFRRHTFEWFYRLHWFFALIFFVFALIHEYAP